ncbi:hypothetical protein, partial [Ruminococcus callidus]|uniref:hypothetical protein n=1 Tax=Ruminococcus callidus TaxID=40519 RepID=UPI0023F1CF4A
QGISGQYDGKSARRLRAKSPDALCAVLPKIQCKTAGRTLCRAAIEERRHISALQTESTFFTSEICAKKALHKMQKVCYNDIMHSLCISNRFPKQFHALF